MRGKRTVNSAFICGAIVWMALVGCQGSDEDEDTSSSTETSTDTGIDTGSETDIDGGADSGTDTDSSGDTETASDTETESETASDTETATDTETETTLDTETATDSDTETESASDTNTLGIFDWRDVDGEDWTTPAKDQSAMGSCFAFAIVSCMEAAYNIAKDDPDLDLDLSELFLQQCAPSQSEYLEFAMTTGVPVESCLPNPLNTCELPPECNEADGTLVKISDAQVISVTDAEIKNGLQYGPVLIPIYASDALYAYTGGIYDPEPGQMNHAAAIVGWNDTNNTWYAKNSWGTNWGLEGFFEVRRGTGHFGPSATRIQVGL